MFTRGIKLTVVKKSYAVSYSLQDSEKTLTDKYVDKVMQNIIKNLADKLKATLR